MYESVCDWYKQPSKQGSAFYKYVKGQLLQVSKGQLLHWYTVDRCVNNLN